MWKWRAFLHVCKAVALDRYKMCDITLQDSGELEIVNIMQQTTENILQPTWGEMTIEDTAVLHIEKRVGGLNTFFNFLGPPRPGSGLRKC